MRRIDIKAIVGSEFLAGSEQGNKHLPLLEAALKAGEAGETIIMDWSGIELSTASYFASTLVPLLRRVIAGEPDVYPILAGLNRTCMEELKVVAGAEGIVALVAPSLRTKRVSVAKVIGDLDSAYAETLSEVVKRGKVSARELHLTIGRTCKIGKTAWINRLVTLNRLRLIRRSKVGRNSVYQPAYLEA